MNALINAHSKEGGEATASPLCDGLAPNALPEAQGSQTGVSVENAQSAKDKEKENKLQWFVLQIGRAHV